MSFIETDSLVRALLHTLWQGGLAFLVLSVALALIPVRRASLRYGLCLLALVLVLIAGIATWAWIDVSKPRTAPPVSPVAVAAVPAPQLSLNTNIPQVNEMRPTIAPEPARHSTPRLSLSPSWVPGIAAFWGLGVVVSLIRCAGAVMGVGSLRRSSRETDDPRLMELACNLCRALGIQRSVRLLVSERISLPAVIGVLRPAILIPASLLTGLPPEYLRAVLAHEFAHIARWDYLVNLGQMLIEALFFFNPFVWWISRQIRLEREACCDLAASVDCADPGLYVKAILACTETFSTNVGLPSAALALGRRDSSFIDRVRRLLLPGHGGSVRIPWITLAGAIAVTGLILFAMGKGAFLAAHILTPKERIERIGQLKQESEIHQIAKKQITVSGTVVTEDGSPLSERPQIYVDSLRNFGPGGARYKESLFGPIHADGKFSVSVSSGIVNIAAMDDGRPPSFVGPLRGDHDLAGLRVVLLKGFSSAIRVTDSVGHPLEGVRIEGYYQGPPRLNPFKVKTDALGEVQLKAVSEAKLTFEAVKPGFQTARIADVRLKETTPLEWKLDMAHPLKGRVISEETGAPVSGAKVEVVQAGGPNGIASSSPGNEKNPAARTDAQGEFIFDTLRDDSSYWLHVQADGFRPMSGPRVTVQGGPLEIKLGAPLHIKGRIVFPKESISTGTVTVECHQVIRWADHSQGVQQQTKVAIRDNVAEFAFSNLYLDREQTEIVVNGIHTKVPDFHESLDNFVIDFASHPAHRELPLRQVVIRLDRPLGAPAPEGELRIGYLKNGAGPDVQRVGVQENFPVKNGEVRLEVPVPNELNIGQEGLIGYAFKESGLRASHGVPVPEGNGPAEIHLAVTPAGAIRGEVVEADGSPARAVMISVVPGEWQKDGSNFSLDVKNASYGVGDFQAPFVATPLPLGSSYAILVYRGSTYVLGPSLRIDEKNPIRNVRIVIPDGNTLRGRVTDEAGHPVAFMDVGFSYDVYPNQRFSSVGGQTDGDGQFTVPHVNLDAPGEYYLQVEPRANYVPMAVKVNPQHPQTDIQLVKGHVISGVAIDSATGKPLAGIEIVASPVSPSTIPPSNITFPIWYKAEAITDTQGRFRFSNLPAGVTVRIGAQNANIDGSGDSNTAKPDQLEPVVLKLKPSA